MLDANTVRAEWKIADGYYMYRKHFKFSSETDGVSLGKPVYPKGEIKQDEIFGKVEVYKHSVSINIPVTNNSAASSLAFVAKSQGCNEPVGVCYPPMSSKVSLTLAAASPGKNVAALSSLSQQLGIPASAEEPPMPEEAFKLRLDWQNDNTLLAHWDIVDGAYLYADKFKFQITTGSGYQLGTPNLPKGEAKFDEVLGKEIVAYYKSLDVGLPVTRTASASDKFSLYLEYQGCSETFGICYPPIKKTLEMTPPAGMTAAADSVEAATAAPADTGSTPSEKVSQTPWEVIVLLAIAFASGFGLTFTPCVLPMLPIISGIIVGQGESVTKTRGGILASVYVLGTAVVWTAAGAVAGATGEQLQAYTSHPYFIIPVALVLFALALAMFGLYNIQLPTALQSKAQESSQGVKGGTMAGVFMMGILASVIAGACVSPILILNLGVAMQAQDPILGGGIMLFMAMGMGVPIILVGIGAGWLLPRAGAWFAPARPS